MLRLISIGRSGAVSRTHAADDTPSVATSSVLAIVGKALYAGAFTLPEALRAVADAG